MRIRVGYFAKEAVDSFRHNMVIGFAAIVVVLFSLLLVGGFVLMTQFIGQVATDIEQKVEIEVFMKDSAPKEDVYAIERKIKALKDVDSVEYISKKEALEIFVKRNRNNQDLIQDLPGNPLPASYRVFLKNPQKVEDVAEKINLFSEKEGSIESMNYGRDYVRKIFAVTNWLRFLMLAGIILLSVVSLMLIANTIRLAIYARRKEIAIMRLVGASNWFIRWPFLLEGIIEGLAGSLLAIGVLATLRYIFQSKLESSLQFLASVQISPAFFQNLLVILLASGMLIGAAGSMIALRRYLKI